MIVSIDAEAYIDYYSWLINNNQIPKYYGSYLKHILNHKYMVHIAWIYIRDTLINLGFIDEDDASNIDNLIINHDDSKLQRDEFIPYAKRYNGSKKKNPLIKNNFKNAVKLHKERNIHHYEKLKSYKGENWRLYAIELVCDYIAMGWEFNNYVYEYFQKEKDELKKDLPDNYYKFIESVINLIPETFPLAEESLTKHKIEQICHIYNDPFEDDSKKKKKTYTRKKNKRLDISI